MEFLKIVAPNYENALREARSKYGASVRMQTRRDYEEKHLFSTKHFCEISFYLVDDGSAPTDEGKADS